MRLVAKLVPRSRVFCSEEVLIVDLWKITGDAADFLALGLQAHLFGQDVARFRPHVLYCGAESALHVHLLRLVDTFQLRGHHRVLLFVLWFDCY